MKLSTKHRIHDLGFVVLFVSLFLSHNNFFYIDIASRKPFIRMPKSPRSTRRKRKFISQAPENDPMAPSLTLGDNNGEEVATNEAGDETPAFKRTETFKPTAMDMARHETGQGGTEAQDQPSPSKVGSPPDERIGKVYFLP